MTLQKWDVSKEYTFMHPQQMQSKTKIDRSVKAKLDNEK